MEDWLSWSFLNSTCEGIEDRFNSYPDLDIPFVSSSAIIKTGAYFLVLAIINRICPLLTNYRLLAGLVQVALQTLPTLLYMLQLNPSGIMAQVYNLIPQWVRPHTTRDSPP